MEPKNEPDGMVVTIDGRKFLRLVRAIDRSIERVWIALAVPDRVAD